MCKKKIHFSRYRLSARTPSCHGGERGSIPRIAIVLNFGEHSGRGEPQQSVKLFPQGCLGSTPSVPISLDTTMKDRQGLQSGDKPLYPGEEALSGVLVVRDSPQSVAQGYSLI